MMCLKSFLSASLLIMATSAHAHVRVLPLEAQTGARQTYTMKVPTEGKVATTSVELEIPLGLSVISIANPAEIKKVNAQISVITWKVEIPPGESQAFDFVAQNPNIDQEIVWRAHQHYADGTSRDWVDQPHTKNPASVTTLSTTPQRTAH